MALLQESRPKCDMPDIEVALCLQIDQILFHDYVPLSTMSTMTKRQASR